MGEILTGFVSKPITATVRAIVRQAGLTVDDFLAL